MEDFYELKEARTALLMKAPFFATLMYNMMKIRVTDMVPTLGTDGTNLYINKEYFCDLTLGERVFALAHEIAHAMFHHMARGKNFIDMGFDGNKFLPWLYNVAGDFVINALLKESNIGSFKHGWLLDHRFDATWNVDDVYRKLYDELPEDGKGEGQSARGNGGEGEDEDSQGNSSAQSGDDESESGSADGVPQGNPADQGGGGRYGDTQDTHFYAESKQTRMEWKQQIESAALAAKSQGRLPGNLARLVGAIVEPEVDWRDHLKQAMVNTFGYEEKTWSRPSRRHMSMYNEYLPGRTGYGCGSIIAVIDTSGSISEKELTAFVSEISGILTDARPEELWVLGIDAQVHDEQKCDGIDDLIEFSKQLKGGGGTHMPAAFGWAEENDVKPDSMVILTDGYTDFGDEPDYPVVWAITSDIEAEFGETVHVKVQ